MGEEGEVEVVVVLEDEEGGDEQFNSSLGCTIGRNIG